MIEETIVQLVDAVKCFDKDENPVVKGISLDIKRGEFLTILGPSGCGKTTTLRVIAGFEQLTSGKLYIDKEEVSKKQPYERCVNTVFQSYALFPHMNVYNNIAFGLTMKKVSKDEIHKRVMELLKIVRLEGYEHRMPNQLSGGQKQRVAIARAIINNPKVLLLDEPLGALDLKLRKEMQLELKHLQKKLGITFVYVTHDQEEALTMSDRIAVMNAGNIEQLGTPEEIYERPATKFVADFIGETNLVNGQVNEVINENIKVKIDDNSYVLIQNNGFEKSDKVCLAIRPENIKIKLQPENNDQYIKGRFKERIYVGSVIRTVMETPSGEEITISELPSEKFDITNESLEFYLTWNHKNAVVVKA